MAKTVDKAEISKQTNRKIFVTKLLNTTMKQLRGYFSKYGTVTDVTILEPSRTSAFVTFETSDESQLVLNQKCEHKIKGSLYPICVYEAITKHTDNYESECEIAPIATQHNEEVACYGSAIPMEHFVCVERLPLNTTAKDIRIWFSKYGTITHIDLTYRHSVAIAFEDLHMAQSLLELEGKLKIDGNLIHLSPGGNTSDIIQNDEVVEYRTRTGNSVKTHSGCGMDVFAVGMQDTLRLIKNLDPARGYASSMISLYLNNGDKPQGDACVDLLVHKLEREYQDTLEFYAPHESLEKSKRQYGNLAATKESFKTIKKCLQLNATTSRRGRVIFCGTVFAYGGEMRQVLVEFEPYTLITDKTFCYFDNKFHLSPLAFKLINYQLGDGLQASNFKKVAEAFGDDLEESLASFNINFPPDWVYVRDPARFFHDGSFLFGCKGWSPDILRGVRVDEVTRMLRLIESLRLSGHDNTKKMILIVKAADVTRVTEFLRSNPDLEEARNAPSGSISPFCQTPKRWRNAAEQLLKVGSFLGDLSAKRCFEYAEERLNSHSQVIVGCGLIIYCGLGMSVGGREMKFSVELEPCRPVLKNQVIYTPDGHYDLKPLEELAMLEDDLVPFALDPKNAPPGIMSHEKMELLIRLVGELASKPDIE